MADEVDGLIVLALLQVACLGECDDQGLGPQGWPFSCPPDLDADPGRQENTSVNYKP